MNGEWINLDGAQPAAKIEIASILVQTRPERLDWPTLTTMATTPGSTALSKALKARGWSFVGPTTVYAFMQAMGLVNDHLHGCHCREEVERERAAFRRPQ